MQWGRKKLGKSDKKVTYLNKTSAFDFQFFNYFFTFAFV